MRQFSDHKQFQAHVLYVDWRQMELDLDLPAESMVCLILLIKLADNVACYLMLNLQSVIKVGLEQDVPRNVIVSQWIANWILESVNLEFNVWLDGQELIVKVRMNSWECEPGVQGMTGWRGVNCQGEDKLQLGMWAWSTMYDWMERINCLGKDEWLRMWAWCTRYGWMERS